MGTPMTIGDVAKHTGPAAATASSTNPTPGASSSFATPSCLDLVWTTSAKNSSFPTAAKCRAAASG